MTERELYERAIEAARQITQYLFDVMDVERVVDEMDTTRNLSKLDKERACDIIRKAKFDLVFGGEEDD